MGETTSSRSVIISGLSEKAAHLGRAAFWMNEEEADALMTLLLHVPASTPITAEIADHLLCRVAEVQRELVRDTITPPCVKASPVRRRRSARASGPVIVRRRARRRSQTGITAS